MYRHSLSQRSQRGLSLLPYKRSGAPHRRSLRRSIYIVAALGILSVALIGCVGNTPSTSSSPPARTQHIDNGTITYSGGPQDVLIRTFRGGGHLGTLDFSPEISIYGDGSYILGPGLDMHQGQLDAASLQQLLHNLVDTDGLLNLKRRLFYDIPDQDATLLQVALNGTNYQFVYGQFGVRQESQQDLDEYRLLGKALSIITQSLNGPTHPYTNEKKVLLAHQDFSPDLTQNIPSWTVPDFTLGDLATYECGPIPQDITGPNADPGCLTFDIPQNALLLSKAQLHTITDMLHGKQQGEFYEPDSGLYYTVVIRPLLPDELKAGTLAMYGSENLTYTGVPLHQGAVPTAAPTP